MSVNLKTNFAGIDLNNPTILASGILGVSKSSLNKVIESGAGAVTIKSISLEVRKGHETPIITTFEAGMLNAVGYSNPGAKEAAQEFSNLNELGAPVIASIIGQKDDDFKQVWEHLAGCGFVAIEVPLSCPHTPGFGTMGGQHTPEMSENITKLLREISGLPIIVKVSPNNPNMIDVAKAAEAAGAAAICAVNTAGPGMQIDIESARPVLGFKIGGLSGPALKPIAIRCVYDLYEAVKIPIIGTGGITTAEDAIEMLMAGATALGIGTAVYYGGPEVFKKITEEMSEWLEKHDYKDIKEVIGLVHKH
ncbi:dihydroorotate dehydrogenase [Patescibacteria group bacterium]|nr:dihydroorotate dehydrogenase [Patescibacteria group bacterium]